MLHIIRARFDVRGVLIEDDVPTADSGMEGLRRRQEGPDGPNGHGGRDSNKADLTGDCAADAACLGGRFPSQKHI